MKILSWKWEMPWKNLKLQSKYRYLKIQCEYLQNNNFTAYFLKQETSFRPQQEHCNQVQVFWKANWRSAAMTKANLLQDVYTTNHFPCKWALCLPHHCRMSIKIIREIHNKCLPVKWCLPFTLLLSDITGKI